MRWGSYGELPCVAGLDGTGATGPASAERPSGRSSERGTTMSAWNAMTYEGKDTILRVVRDEAERMFAMAEAPGAWEEPTANALVRGSMWSNSSCSTEPHRTHFPPSNSIS